MKWFPGESPTSLELSGGDYPDTTAKGETVTAQMELYDLSKDGSETYDVAQKFPKRTMEMEQRWNEWAYLTGTRKRP